MAGISLLLALCAWVGRSAEEGTAPAEPPPAAPYETFEEHFVLLDPADPQAEPLGVSRLVRHQRSETQWQLEQDQHWFPLGLRLHLVERYDLGECQLIYRELGPGRGRTLRVHWPQDRADPPLSRVERLREWEPEVIEWCGTERRSRRFEGARGWRGPLALAEQLRYGLVTSGSVARFEPLAALPEPVVVTLRLGPPSPAPLRCFHLAGEDGATRGLYVFAGCELLASAAAGGGPLALRISAARHDELLAGAGVRPPDLPAGRQ
jgi:hypothetical protein